MTRKEFIKICSLLGISFPLQNIMAISNSNKPTNKFKGKVLIIGAGAAGLTAAYQLSQLGIDFQILEASSKFGGRLKTMNDFVDFPIPLGAEWLHVEETIFDEIINNPKTKINIKLKGYNENDYALYDGEETSITDMGFDSDQKFIGSSWLDFFKEYILPTIQDKITYNQIVKSINYTSNEVIINTQNNVFKATKVIVTVPVKMLQNNTITFTPQLPKNKQKAIKKVTVWDGFKAFIEFSEKFYPSVTEFNVDGEKMYYDASYGQKSDHNVLGLFIVGPVMKPYLQSTDTEIIRYILQELDELFDYKASENYIKHTSQNWSKEPFVEGAYVYNNESWRIVKTLSESVNNKLFFAGTAYTKGNDWGSVHSAARSAIRTINEILS